MYKNICMSNPILNNIVKISKHLYILQTRINILVFKSTVFLYILFFYVTLHVRFVYNFQLACRLFIPNLIISSICLPKAL